jgi:REP element-mobilizing transposase RayT
MNHEELLCEITTVRDAARGVPLSPPARGVPPSAATNVPIIRFTTYGDIVKKHIENIPNVNPNVFLDRYAIMPNHIHLLLRIAAELNTGTPRAALGNGTAREDGANGTARAPLGNGTARAPSPTGAIIPKIINSLKGLTSKKAGFSLWQRSYYDHIVRDEDDYNRIVEYIENNPIRWHEDCFHTST